jgi:hypothetical protein
MPQKMPTSRHTFVTDPAEAGLALWRGLGARAHQLRATTRGADHFNALDNREDRNTGSWLMSCALGLAAELADDLDAVARAMKDRPADTAAVQRVSALRKSAHELHAAARAADHFLDQDTPEDHDTGSWLIATARELATRLAGDIDDHSGVVRRTALDRPAAEPHDAGLARRIAAATEPVRGAG